MANFYAKLTEVGGAVGLADFFKNEIGQFGPFLLANLAQFCWPIWPFFVRQFGPRSRKPLQRGVF